MSNDINLNDAIIALEKAEGRIDEVENEDKLIEAIESLNAVPVAELKELANEWEEVASWGKRDNQSKYQRGLKDATKDSAQKLRELIENYD